MYARPPTIKPGNPWAYSQVTEKRHSRSYTMQTPRSTIRRNRIHIRRATPPPSSPRTPPYTRPTLLPRPGHNLAILYNSLGSELNTPLISINSNHLTRQTQVTADQISTPLPHQNHKNQIQPTGAKESRLPTHLLLQFKIS